MLGGVPSGKETLGRHTLRRGPRLEIAESHLAIHTWPEFGYAAVDVAENTTAVTDVASTDDSDTEGAGLTYTLSPTPASANRIMAERRVVRCPPGVIARTARATGRSG